MSLLKTIHHHLSAIKNSHGILILIIWGALVYQNAINHPFVHDDVYFIVNNPNIAHFDLGQIFHGTVFNSLGGEIVNIYYRPFLELGYRSLHLFFGLNASAYHLVNVCLHITNASFIFLICQRMFALSRLVSLAIACIFLLHPIQVEAVACISGISNTLYVFWGMISLWAYSVSINRWQPGKPFYILLSLGAFLLSLLTKEQAIVIPVLLVAYEVFCRREQGSKRPWVNMGLYVLVVIFYFLFRQVMIGHPLALGVKFDYELWLRVLSIAPTLLMYGRIIFWPKDLHYYRSIDLLDVNVWAWGILLLILLAVFFIYRRLSANSQRLYLFGMIWFFGTIAPVLNIIPLVNEYSFILTSEHFLYWPIVGILLMGTAILHDVIVRKISTDYDPSLIGMTIVILMVFSVLSIGQNRIWASEVRLFTNTVKYQPYSGRIRLLLANALYREGRFEEGLVHYERARDIMGSYVRKVTLESTQKAYLHYLSKSYLGLITGYEQIGNNLAARPYYDKWINAFEPSVALYNAYAINYLKTGETPQAIEKFQAALALEPTNLQLMNSLAICYVEVGDLKKAEQLLQQIAQKDPNSLSAKENLDRVKRKLTQKKIVN